MRALVVVLVAGWATLAVADQRDDARREFNSGQAADQNRDWQRAIEHYTRAHQMIPHPNTAYNIAVDFERLGRLREAAQWFERYRELVTDARERDKIEMRVKELAARAGSITVRSNPDGAKVAIDDRDVGITPYSAPIEAGTYRVTVAGEQRSVTIEYGEPVTVDVAGNAPIGTPAVAPVFSERLYTFGLGGGVDARGAGGIWMIELGLRYRWVEGLVRYAIVDDQFGAVDVLGRVSLPGKLSPFAGIGYSTAFDQGDGGGSSKGLLLSAGARYDLANTPVYVLVVQAELGVRVFGELAMRDSVFVPVTATLQFGRRL